MTFLIACILIYKLDLPWGMYWWAAMLYLFEAQLTGKLQAFLRFFKRFD